MIILKVIIVKIINQMNQMKKIIMEIFFNSSKFKLWKSKKKIGIYVL